jgi:hypothetical protein
VPEAPPPPPPPPPPKIWITLVLLQFDGIV